MPFNFGKKYFHIFHIYNKHRVFVIGQKHSDGKMGKY